MAFQTSGPLLTWFTLFGMPLPLARQGKQTRSISLSEPAGGVGFSIASLQVAAAN